MTIKGSFFHQLRRRPLFSHPAIFQYHNVVRSSHGSHPVCNNQDRLACQQAGKGTLYLGFILNIQTSSGLVKQDDGCILQKCPGDRDALPLPDGKLCPVFTAGSVIAFSGRRRMNSTQLAASAAACTSSSLAPLLPRRIFSITVSSKGTTSWNTIE